MKATYKKRKTTVDYSMVELEPGQFIFGLNSAVNQLPLSLQSIRTCIKVLIFNNQITRQTTNRYSIISIVNWERYQGNGCGFNIQTNSKPTNSQQASNNKQESKNNIHTASQPDAVDSGDSYLTRKKRKLAGKRFESFNRFWEAFGYKKGKAEAADAWLEIPQLTNTLVEQIVSAAESEAKRRPDLIANGKTPKMAQGWISGRRWEDEEYEPKQERLEYVG